MKRLRLLLAVAALTLGVVASAIPASASPPSGYGFDNTAHLIVGGGSDTTYKAMVNITDLYNGSKGCEVTTANGPSMNQCIVPSPNNPETNTLGNYQRDTVAQANPTGSSAGIAALNGFGGSVYAGTVGGAPNFARSSRTPKTSGGNCTGGNELTCDTFWGFAQDGVEVLSFNNRAAEIQGLGGSALTVAQVAGIFNCTITTWDQVTGNPADAGQPIVPWKMNSNSGTYATFKTWLQTTGGLGSSFDPNAGACYMQLTNGTQPLENNVAPLLADQGTSTNPTSINNPENWIGWGSFGELSAFPFKNKGTAANSTLYTAGDLPIAGVRPSPSNILQNTWTIGRTLYHVTLKTDADCPKTSGSCDFVGNPGPTISGSVTDLNVVGGSSGVSGAVREFTRFLCRPGAAQQATDPYTGVNNNTGLSSAINKAGYQIVPSGLRSAGSRCAVIS